MNLSTKPKPSANRSYFWIGKIKAKLQDTKDNLREKLQGTSSFALIENDPSKETRVVMILSRDFSEDTLQSIFKTQTIEDLMVWNGSDEVPQTKGVRKQPSKFSNRKLRTVGGCLRRYIFFVDFFKKRSECVELNSHEFSQLMLAAMKYANQNTIEDLITQIFSGISVLEPTIQERLGFITTKLVWIENRVKDMEGIANKPDVDRQGILVAKKVFDHYVVNMHNSLETISNELFSSEPSSKFRLCQERLEDYKTDATTVKLLCALQNAMDKWQFALEMTNWEVSEWILIDESLSDILKREAIALSCAEELITYIASKKMTKKQTETK